MRTTVDIDTPILKELKKLGKKEGKSLGRLITDLLAEALHDRQQAKRPTESPGWITRDMRARVDLEDKDALYSVLDTKGADSTQSG